MSSNARTERYMRAVNHGLFLNKGCRRLGRRASFSLAASIAGELPYDRIEEREAEIFSQGAMPAPRSADAEELMADLILGASTLRAFSEIKRLGNPSMALYFHREIRNMYERETAPSALDDMYQRMGRFIESSALRNPSFSVPDFGMILSALDGMMDGAWARTDFGLEVLHDLLEQSVRQDFLLRMGVLRQLADYLNLESINGLAALGNALDVQAHALAYVERFLPAQGVFHSALKVANAMGTFLALEKSGGAPTLRMQPLSREFSVPVGSARRGIFSACLYRELLTDDLVHAGMVAEKFRDSVLRTEILLRNPSRREADDFLLFFDSSSEPCMVLCGSSQRARVMEEWLVPMERKKMAELN